MSRIVGLITRIDRAVWSSRAATRAAWLMAIAAVAAIIADALYHH